MIERELALIDLVVANRVLARVGAVDAYGHVSVRNPLDKGRFLISRSLSPEFVTQEDVMECCLDGSVLDADNRPAYLERFIHAGVYKARPDVQAVVHGHARVLIPFTVAALKMRPVFLTADEIGDQVPVWDIRSKFGDSTDLLITCMDQADDLASGLGVDGRVVLMRGHGFIAAGRSASQLIRICKALIDNAHVQLEASRFGDLKELTSGEIAARRVSLADDESPGLRRGFDYEAVQSGLGHLLERRNALLASMGGKTLIAD